MLKRYQKQEYRTLAADPKSKKKKYNCMSCSLM